MYNMLIHILLGTVYIRINQTRLSTISMLYKNIDMQFSYYLIRLVIFIYWNLYVYVYVSFIFVRMVTIYYRYFSNSGNWHSFLSMCRLILYLNVIFAQ